MTRTLRLAGAQMGPNSLSDTRPQVLARMIGLLEAAAKEGAQLVVFPELAFTTFFPRWAYEGKEKMFDFAAHRRPQWYGSIVQQTGAVEPPAAAE
jgi:predicted amidohydrolase